MSRPDRSQDPRCIPARVRVIIEGRVQGVFFRASAAAVARAVGVVGFALNRADGAVEIVAEGERAKLERLLAWAQTGPPQARVDQVRVEWGVATGAFGGFVIR